MLTQQKSEKGQALIFIVIGFVIILGFVGLAIDGGRVYSDRRHAQNSADAASLAGGAAAALDMENSHLFYDTFDCDKDDGRIASAIQLAKEAAIARAGSNGFSIDTDVDDFHGVTTTCGTDFSKGFADKYIDITVDITTFTQAYFAQFFANESLKSQVYAVTRVRPRMPSVYGHAIVALGKMDCSGNKYGVIFGGDIQVKVNGGGIFSNGCMSNNGGAFNVAVTNGSIAYAGTLEGGGDNYTPAPIHAMGTMPAEASQIKLPNCNDPNAHVVQELKENDFPLEKGLWCVMGTKDIKLTGGEITGKGVTIYVDQASVDIGGNATIDLEAPEVPTPEFDPSPAIPGLLFYVANGDADLQGNNTSKFLGTVFVPNGTIKVHGTPGMNPTFNTQLIGEHVDISGNAYIDIRFNKEQNYQIPTGMELNR